MTITAKRPERPAKPQSRSRAPSPATNGSLTIAIKPWGEVWIDGQKRGISPPLFKLQLRPGTYQLELRNPGLPSHEQRLEIMAGQSVTLQHNVQ